MSKGRYAKTTDVSPEQSEADIQAVLERYKADHVAIETGNDRVRVSFVMAGRWVRFDMHLPEVDDFLLDKIGRSIGEKRARESHRKAVRVAWRSLLLTIQGKLEAYEVGIESFDSAFMAQLVTVHGETVGEFMARELRGGAIRLLPPPPGVA